MDGSTSIADTIATAHTDLPVGEDVQAALQIPHQLKQPGEVLRPGDSRTLLIMTRMLLYESGQEDREIELTPMQLSRNVEDDPAIKDMKLEDMLKLSGGTTQWASSGILLQDRDPDEIRALLKTVDEQKKFMLNMSVQVKLQWLANRAQETSFTPEQLLPEVTIQRQARHAYAARRSTEPLAFTARHSEDALYAVCNGDMTIEEAEVTYPSLRRHETDRIEELHTFFKYGRGRVDTIDHRIAQAALLTGRATSHTKKSAKAVNKTWPEQQFFPFVKILQQCS